MLNRRTHGDAARKLLAIAACVLFLMPGCPAPATAKKIIPEFLAGVEIDHGLRSRHGQVLEKDKLSDLKEFIEKNNSFFKGFMEHYQGEIPTLVITPPLKMEDLDFWPLVRSDIPHFNQARIAARSMWAFGDYYLLTNQPRTAARIYLATLKYGIDLGYGFGTVPSLITQMISVAVQKGSLHRLACLFASGMLDHGLELQYLQRVNDLLELRRSIGHACRSERAFLDKWDLKKDFSMKVFQTVNEGEEKEELKKSVLDHVISFMFGRRGTIHLRAMLATYYGEIERGVKKGFLKSRPHFKRAGRYIEQWNEELMHKKRNAVLSPSRYLALTIVAIALPNCDRAYGQDMTVFALRGGLELVHRLNEFKRRRGAFPETLDDLEQVQYPKNTQGISPSVPLDPFTDKHFIYRKTRNSFILYSPSYDGQDDNMDGSTDLVVKAE